MATVCFCSPFKTKLNRRLCAAVTTFAKTGIPLAAGTSLLLRRLSEPLNGIVADVTLMDPEKPNMEVYRPRLDSNFLFGQ